MQSSKALFVSKGNYLETCRELHGNKENHHSEFTILKGENLSHPIVQPRLHPSQSLKCI